MSRCQTQEPKAELGQQFVPCAKFNRTMPQRFFAFLLIAVLFGACSPNNVTVDNSIGKYFDSAGVKGSFGFYDNGQGHFTIYNLTRFRDSAYAAGTTFDVLQGLIALQSGVATNDTTPIVRAGGITLRELFKGEMETKGIKILAISPTPAWQAPA
jgi:hypothetical protein